MHRAESHSKSISRSDEVGRATNGDGRWMGAGSFAVAAIVHVAYILYWTWRALRLR